MFWPGASLETTKIVDGVVTKVTCWIRSPSATAAVCAPGTCVTSNSARSRCVATELAEPALTVVCGHHEVEVHASAVFDRTAPRVRG
jgi:hypothetical protein